MALMGILMAIAAGGLRGYYQYAQQKKLNEQARLIYLSAQAELTRRFQNGGCREMEGGLTSHEESLPDRVFCLEGRGGENGDYARYQKGELKRGEPEDERIWLLYDLIEPYLWDKSILQEGTVHLELDTVDGQVYASFYSTQYLEGFGGQEELLQERRRGKEIPQIGYYGINALMPVPLEQGERPRICGLQLRQKAGLTAEWRVEARSIDAWKCLSYQVTFYGKNQQEEEEVLGTLLLNQDFFGADEIDGGYGGIPKRFFHLAPGGGYQSVQGIWMADHQAEWCQCLVQLDEYQDKITLLLDTHKFWEYEAGKSQEEETDFDQESRTIQATSSAASSSDGKKSDAGSRSQAARMEREEPDRFSLLTILEQAGWGPETLKKISCTVTAYGEGYRSGAVKESNHVFLDFQEEMEMDMEADIEEETDAEEPGTREAIH